jgi:hypothetical protein
MRTKDPTMRRRQRGAALIEFALIALALYLLLAGGIELGRAVFSTQILQDVARVAARELAVTRLPAAYTFEDALEDCRVRRRVFDERYLVVDLDRVQDLDGHFARMPAVNQMLRPLMIYDRPVVQGRTRNLLRYPGALLFKRGIDNCGMDEFRITEFTVGVPLVVDRRGRGYETIRWVPVLEEVRPDAEDSRSGPFSVNGPGVEVDAFGSRVHGVVAVRVNYPYQAAALSSFRESPKGPYEPNLKFANLADDRKVAELNPAPGDPTMRPVLESLERQEAGPYSGPYGLGRQMVMGVEVRPFRRLLSAQAVFRREVFE